MAAIERKPLTAYQRRLRKELGGDEDDQPTVDQQLARLEVDIRRLKVEFDIFFNGGTKHPPYETRNRVETTFARLGDDRSITYAQRYKFNSLSSRFASFRDLWRRSIQSREEGRDFITVARAKLTAMRDAADAEIAARNAAKKGAILTSANEPPKATTLVENSAPELITPALVEPPVTAIAKGPVATAPVVPAVVSTPPPPQIELVPPVEIEAKDGSTSDSATDGRAMLAANESIAKVEDQILAGAEPVVDENDHPEAEFESLKQVEYQTDGFGADPVPVEIEDIASDIEAVAVRVVVADADESVAAIEAVDEVTSRGAAKQQPVAYENKPLKPLPTRFPKILPPSAHAVEQPKPLKYVNRAGDRRSEDRRALPFGRRATDYTPEELKPTDAAPIIVPIGQLTESPFEVAPDTAVQSFDQTAITVKVAETLIKPSPTPRSRIKTRSAETSNVPNEEVGSFEFTNPRREPDQVKALVAALVTAKEACGESSADLLPTRYGHLLAARADKLKKNSGCERVIFTIVIEDGQVNLNARAGD